MVIYDILLICNGKYESFYIILCLFFKEACQYLNILDIFFVNLFICTINSIQVISTNVILDIKTLS